MQSMQFGAESKDHYMKINVAFQVSIDGCAFDGNTHNLMLLDASGMSENK